LKQKRILGTTTTKTTKPIIKLTTKSTSTRTKTTTTTTSTKKFFTTIKTSESFDLNSLNEDKNEIASLFELYDEPSIFDFYDDAFFDEYENQINIKNNANLNITLNYSNFLLIFLVYFLI
jgi:hypothetical protein